MGTYIYSGLHPRTGTIPVHTFFPGLGGKPVVAMKASIVIEGQSLQRVQLKEVKAIMEAYEHFLIPIIHETDQEYDYALLVENLDNESVPDKVANGSSNPGESFIGFIIDSNPLDRTYTVACGPMVFTNVTTDFPSISLVPEFPCVQIQVAFDSCVSSDKICDSKAKIKKLLDPMHTIISEETPPDPRQSTKQKREHVFPPLAAMTQTQSSLTKSSKPVSSTTSAYSLPHPLIVENTTQGKKSTSSTSSSSSETFKFSLQQTQNNPTNNLPFKPFTGWCGSLKKEHLPETNGGSSSSLSYESFEEDPCAMPDPCEPFGRSATTPFIECLRTQPQKKTEKSRNLKASTSSSSLSYKSAPSQSHASSTEIRNSPLSTSSASALRHEPFEEDPWAMPDPCEPFGRSATTPFIECLRTQPQKKTEESSNLKPFTSSANLSYRLPHPQVQASNLTPSTGSFSSSILQSHYSKAQTTSVNSKNLTPSASSRSTHSSYLEPSTSTASSIKHTFLLPQASTSTAPVTEDESDTEAEAGVCSQMSLEDFEALKPTLSSLEKESKMIEDLMTVTIGNEQSHRI